MVVKSCHISSSVASCVSNICREALVRFGYGLGVERFEPFRFSVPAVPLKKGFCVFQYSLTGKGGSGCGSWKTVSVPVPLSVSEKNGSDGSGFQFRMCQN